MNVTKVQSNVMLVLPHVTMELLNVIKNKGIIKCDKRTVTYDVRTAQCEDEIIKCEKNKGIIECNKSIVTYDIGITQCEDGTIKCKKKKIKKRKEKRNH